MDPVSTTIAVVTVLWKLTIGTREALSDSKANNERAKRLESKAKALATVIGEAGNLYRADATGTSTGDLILPATAREKGVQKKIQEEISDCEKDLKRHSEQIDKILRSQRRGNPILTSIKDKLLDNDVGLDLDQIEQSITDHQSNLQLLIQVSQEHRMSEIHKNLYQFLSMIIAHVKSSGGLQLPKRPDDATNAATDPRSQRDANLTPTQSASPGAHEGEENPVDAEDSLFLLDSVQTFFTEQLDSLRHGSLSAAPSDLPQTFPPSSSNKPEIATTGGEQPDLSSNSSSVQKLQRSSLSSGIPASEQSSGFSSLDRLTSNTSQSYSTPAEDSRNPNESEANRYENMADGASIKDATAPTSMNSLGDERMSPEERNEFDQTPLIVAASSGKVDVVKSLVQHGANVEARDQEGATALHVAIGKARWSVVSFLLLQQPEETHEFIEATALDVNVNSSDNLGRTPLHRCALLNSSDKHTTTAIQRLLDLGADVNMRDKGDHAPLYYAVKGPPKYDVVELLLQNSTDVDFEWPRDMSPRIKDELEKHRDSFKC